MRDLQLQSEVERKKNPSGFCLVEVGFELPTSSRPESTEGKFSTIALPWYVFVTVIPIISCCANPTGKTKTQGSKENLHADLYVC